MKNKLLVIILMLMFSTVVFAQNDTIENRGMQRFKASFKKLLEGEINEKRFREFKQENKSIFLPEMRDSNILFLNHTEKYPLRKFTIDKLYIDNIEKLFLSHNYWERITALEIISTAGDHAFEERIIKILESTNKNNPNEQSGLWSSRIEQSCLISTLVDLNNKITDPIFDAVLQNRMKQRCVIRFDYVDIYIFHLIDKDAARETALRKLNSTDISVKKFAIEVLGYTGMNIKTDSILRSEFNMSDSVEIKLEVLRTMHKLQAGNLLGLVQPLLNSENKINFINALLESPTKKDRDYAVDILNSNDSIDNKILACLYSSDKIENTRLFLNLLQTTKISKDFTFNNYWWSNADIQFSKISHPLENEILVSDLYKCLKHITDENMFCNLVYFLAKNINDAQKNMLFDLVESKDKSMKECLIKLYGVVLAEKDSKRVLSVVYKHPYLLQYTIDCFVKMNIDTLHELCRKIYHEEESSSSREKMIKYLLAFPKEKDKLLFRNILNDENQKDYYLYNYSAIGLLKLKDLSSFELIKDRLEYGNISISILKDIAMIKTEEAKILLKQCCEIKSTRISEFATELLQNWDKNEK